jgi:hypothetical protein
MIRTKLGIKVLGLCALAFVLMGIASSGAQASGTWLVLEGEKIVESGEVTLEKDKEIVGVLHSKISGVEVLFECPTISAVGVNLAAGGKTANGGKVKFSGCKTKLNGVVSESCEPTNAGTEKGVILTKAGHALLVLHELSPTVKDELVEVLPDEVGGPFATIEMGKLCSIGTKVPVIGKLYLKDCENAFLKHQEIHLVEEGPLTELFVISKTEEHKASLLGSALARVFWNGLFRSFAGHAG